MAVGFSRSSCESLKESGIFRPSSHFNNAGWTKRYDTQRQFKFESAWLLIESYQDFIKSSWKIDRTMEENLRIVIENIKDWKFNIIDQVKHEKKELMARLRGIQNSMQSRNKHGGLVKLECKL